LRIVHGQTIHDINVDDQLVLKLPEEGGGEIEGANALASQAKDSKPVLIDSDGDGKADLLVSDKLLSESGLGDIRFKVDGRVEVKADAAVELNDGAKLALSGASIEHAGSITAHGGGITLLANSKTTLDTDNYQNNVPIQFPIHLAQGSRLDVSGRFTNDVPVPLETTPTDAIAIDAGSVTLQARGAVTIDSGATIDADGGAYVNRSTTLQAGKGGDVTVISRIPDGADVTLNGDITSYSLKKGGKLSVEAASVVIGDGVDTSKLEAKHVLALDSEFFSAGGFGAYSVTANMQALVVDKTADLTLSAKNYFIDSNNSYLRATSGTDIADFASVKPLPDYLRAATDISLTLSQKTPSSDGGNEFITRDGTFVIEEGAQIKTDVGGKIALQSDNSLFIDGSLDAAGGSITAEIVAHSDISVAYKDTQSLWLGEHAGLTSNAAVVYAPNSEGRNTGKSFDAGDITLWAKRGFLAIESGAQLKASGAAFTFDNLVSTDGGIAVQTQTIAADAGSMNLRGAEGVLLDGTLEMKRADIAGARGGQLDIAVDTTFGNRVGPASANASQFPKVVPVMNINGARDASAVGDLQFGKALADAQHGHADLDASKLNAMDLDILTLEAGNEVTKDDADAVVKLGRIEFENGAALATNQQINLLSTTLQVNDDSVVKIDSAAVALGIEPYVGFSRQMQLAKTPVAGEGALVITADFIDVNGNVSVDKVSELALASRGDIRLRTVVDDSGRDFAQGNLVAGGDITLLAQQVYPSTLSDYRIASTDRSGTITVAKADGTAVTPLSAAGKLTLEAANIDQQGVLRAPLGQIVLGGATTESIQLSSGSITSVSADGNQIPLGRIQGEDILWGYGINEGEPLVIDSTKLPEKTVSLQGAKVDVQKDAVINVSASDTGDVYATEFITGPGGSIDVLEGANAGVSFAIVPTLKNGYSPYDVVESRNTSIELGSTLKLPNDVRLADGTLLPAGEYTMLPARYALQPGAFLITPTATSTGIDPSQNLQRVDGAVVTAGKQAVANTAIEDSSWSGFAIENGSVALKRSEYVKKTSAQFFTADKALHAAVRDAGSVAILASSSLNLDGKLVATHAADARGSHVDITAEKLLITSDGTAADAADGEVVLSANDISGFGAESVLLGGERHRVVADADDKTDTSSQTAIDVKSSSVRVADGAELKGSEFVLAATDTVNVQQNAHVIAQAETQRNTTEQYVIEGDGALLQVSGIQNALVTRNNETGTAGNLVLGSGSQLLASQSVVLDASNNVQIEGAAINSRSLTLSSKQITLGDASGSTVEADAETAGTVLSTALLNGLNLENLTLHSRSDIDIVGDVAINANNLVLRTGSIVSNDHNAVFNATSLLTLEGNEPVAAVDPEIPPEGSETPEVPPTPIASSGTLTFNAGFVQLGDDADKNVPDAALHLDASSVAVNASGGVLLKDVLKIDATGNVNVVTPQITSVDVANIAIYADKALTLEHSGDQNKLLLAASALGARLDLQGTSVALDTTIRLPSGVIKSTATEANLTLGDAANLDVSGITQTFDIEKVASSGGDIALTATRADVIASATSAIDFSGAVLSDSQGSRAGGFTVSAAQGQATLNGSLRGDAVDNAEGGEINVDAQGMTGVDALAAQLSSGGITGLINLRQRSGNIDVAQTTVLTAHDIRLAADTGNVQIAGTLDARGEKGGNIDINAGNDAVLTETAHLDASATSAEGRGGNVSIGSVNGTLALNAGATIDVHGGDNSAANNGFNSIEQGSVHLRARRSVTTNENNEDVQSVAVSAFDATVSKDARVVLEAFDDIALEPDPYAEISYLTSTVMADAKAGADAFMAQASDIVAGLGTLSHHEKFVLEPGVEIRSQGNMSVAEAIDLSSWRYGEGSNAAPGVLTLRSAGNLAIDQSISDGFIMDTTSPGGINKNVAVLTDDFSWDLNLVGGADLGGAKITSTIKTSEPDKADVVIGAGVTVRTGTGDIAVAAGGDVKLLSQSSTLYTAGHSSYYTYTNPYFVGTAIQPETVNLPYTGFLYQRYVNNLLPDRWMYPHEGGDISVDAGNNVTLAESHQISSDWLQRYTGLFPYKKRTPLTTATTDVVVSLNTWGIVASDFEQGIATLGGGDIRVHAGNDIAHLSASAPVTLRQSARKDYDAGILPITGTILAKDSDYVYELNGGGDIDVRAGRDVLSARVLADKGNATIVAGGGIKATTSTVVDPSSGNPAKAYTMISLSDAEVTLSARGDIDIDAIYNTTVVPQSSRQTSETPAVNSIFTYADTSEINLQSDAGNIYFSNNIDTTRFETMANVANASDIQSMFTLAPPRLYAEAPAGSIYIDSSLVLYPSLQGDFGFLAKNTISARPGDIYLSLSDADPKLLPTLMSSNPKLLSDWKKFYDDTFVVTSPSAALHAANPVHLGDTDSATLIAANGDIDGKTFLAVYSAKKMYLSAGGDVADTQLFIQNNNASDISTIKAGGDVVMGTRILPNGTLDSSLNLHKIQISGPGQLLVSAGDDISLGSSAGIISVGNTTNPALADEGASITLLAGIGEGIDYDDFYKNYLTYSADAVGTDRDYTNAMIDYLFSGSVDKETLLPAISDAFDVKWTEASLPYVLLRHMDDGAEKHALALHIFDAVDSQARAAFMLDVMNSEVRKGGIENAKGLVKDPAVDGFKRSYTAINTLFPQYDQSSAEPSVADPGNLSLVFSAVQTLDGGNINFVVPTGKVDVGLAGNFAGFAKESGQLGIVVQGAGTINGVAYDDINVNKSRIFALDGGDLMLWSSQHDIDAGKGAKTALTIPPPRVTVDDQGIIKTEFPAAVNGSGIQAAVITQGRKPGDVYLFAPAGVIDAGDAGISSEGNILLAATKILGADNIHFGGVAVGVPTNTSIASSLTGVSDAASSSTASATDGAGEKSTKNCSGEDDCDQNNAVAFVTVEIIGLGD